MTKGSVTDGVLSIDVDDNTRPGKLFSLTYSDKNALQAASQVVAAKTIYVDKWSLAADKKYVNYSTNDDFITTSTLTLSLTNKAGTTVAKTAATESNILPDDNVAKKGAAAGEYTVTPTSNDNIHVTYTNATPIDITTTNIEWTLKKGEAVKAIGSAVDAGEYDLYVTENGSAAYVSTLSIDHGTITRTGTPGKYKVTVTGTYGATISLNYKGIPNYIQTAYVNP